MDSLDVSVSDSASVGERVVLLHVGSATAYASGGTAEIVITPLPDSLVPKVDISLTENLWDFGTTGFGITVGAVVGHAPGAIVGGIAMYAWGRWRWRQTQGKRDGT